MFRTLRLLFSFALSLPAGAADLIQIPAIGTEAGTNGLPLVNGSIPISGVFSSQLGFSIAVVNSISNNPYFLFLSKDGTEVTVLEPRSSASTSQDGETHMKIRVADPEAGYVGRLLVHLVKATGLLQLGWLDSSMSQPEELARLKSTDTFFRNIGRATHWRKAQEKQVVDPTSKSFIEEVGGIAVKQTDLMAASSQVLEFAIDRSEFHGDFSLLFDRDAKTFTLYFSDGQQNYTISLQPTELGRRSPTTYIQFKLGHSPLVVGEWHLNIFSPTSNRPLIILNKEDTTFGPTLDVADSRDNAAVFRDLGKASECPEILQTLSRRQIEE